MYWEGRFGSAEGRKGDSEVFKKKRRIWKFFRKEGRFRNNFFGKICGIVIER